MVRVSPPLELSHFYLFVLVYFSRVVIFTLLIRA
ncbi:hypothetical protein AciX9_4096 (plasmid) [Granulicella tundricola MP5ACTX9]|uniref:Uncharacterized protein n=1 Tax=Granulicella tundricola (strain ATCC BAA-1859 / DSM 23138 / MP5ACTX9) TaxID=1198114 RepID=E8X5Z2_GRATM|nr:hypothetical protein AciX9_4096 [Granulicella tundricola MP5ACTX9]